MSRIVTVTCNTIFWPTEGTLRNTKFDLTRGVRGECFQSQPSVTPVTDTRCEGWYVIRKNKVQFALCSIIWKQTDMDKPAKKKRLCSYNKQWEEKHTWFNLSAMSQLKHSAVCEFSIGRWGDNDLTQNWSAIMHEKATRAKAARWQTTIKQLQVRHHMCTTLLNMGSLITMNV